MRSKLAIDYPNLEIIAVDDRSQDATGVLLDRLAADDSRFDGRAPRFAGRRLVGQEPRHARRGESCHRRLPSLHRCRRLLCAGPVAESRDDVRGAGARPPAHWHPGSNPVDSSRRPLELYFIVMLCIASQPWLVRTGWRFSYVGVGAFNLVRRSAYAQCGGHTAIRLDVLDDVKLGKLIKHAGLKQDVLDAGEGVRVRWQDGFLGRHSRTREKRLCCLRLLAGQTVVRVRLHDRHESVSVLRDCAVARWSRARLSVFDPLPPLRRRVRCRAARLWTGGFRGLAGRSGNDDLHDVAIGIFHARPPGCSLARHVLSAEPAARARLLGVQLHALSPSFAEFTFRLRCFLCVPSCRHRGRAAGDSAAG